MEQHVFNQFALLACLLKRTYINKMPTVLEISNKQEILNKRERSGEKIRVEIQFHQPNKIVNGLIQSDIHLQMAANEGIRETYGSVKSRHHRARSVLPHKHEHSNSSRSIACRFRTAQTTRRKRCIVANLNVRWNLSTYSN